MSACTGRIARVVAMLGALMPGVARGQVSGPPARGDDPWGAERYFYEMRAFPNARIPAGARQAAMAQMRARWPQAFAQRDALMMSTPNLPSTTTWTPLGPSPITAGNSGTCSLSCSGRLNSIAVDPNIPSTIYAAGAQGGVWKTVNGGTSWVPLTDSQCSLAMGSIAIDPKNTSIIYAGTGELNNSGDSYYGCGILRSTDGGSTWQQQGATAFLRSSGGVRISKVIIDNATAGTTGATVVLAATSGSLYRSVDSGNNWTQVLHVISSDIVQDPTPGSTVMYAAAGGAGGSSGPGNPANGIYKSTDAGVTWTILTGTAPNTLPTTNVGRINLAISQSAPGTLYAAIQDAIGGTGSPGALLGIYRTTDAGATWIKQTATSSNGPMCGSGKQCWYDMSIAVDPTTPTTVYFGGFSVYRSLDGGASFTDIGQAIHVDQHALAFDPTSPATLYAGSDGGIFKTTNATNTAATPTWTSLNTNLVLTQFYQGVSTSPTDALMILGGSQDNGTLQAQSATQSNWLSVFGGDGGFTAIDQLAGQTAFVEFQWTQGTGQGPFRRSSPTTGFTSTSAGINFNDNALFIPPLEMDPVRPRILFFGTTNLYRTANSGDAWTNIGTSLVSSTGNISTIGIAPSDSLTVYVGSSDGRVSYTHDLGTTWTTATGPSGLAVTDFAVDPRDARTAIVTLSGFTPLNHVWRTTDGGATWTNISFDLPDIPTLAVVLEPGSHDIDIGTDLGVFTLRNGATSWKPVVNGLPNVAVYDLVFDAPRSRLIAATHGRGMFSLDVTMTGLRGDVTGPNGGAPDGLVQAIDAQAILAMVVGNAPPAGSVRYPNADANCDGQVTAVDALIVLTKVANASFSNGCVGTIR
jgi:photosystem II stability/assembly factor-like uncharacterized protein